MKSLKKFLSSALGNKSEDNTTKIVQQIPENIDMKSHDSVKNLAVTIKEIQDENPQVRTHRDVAEHLQDNLEKIHNILKATPKEINEQELEKQIKAIKNLIALKGKKTKLGNDRCKKLTNLILVISDLQYNLALNSSVVLAEPSKADPSKADPSKAEPTKAEPTKAEPTKAEPTKAEPTKAEPTKAEPTKAEPTKAEPTKAGSTNNTTLLNLMDKGLKDLIAKSYNDLVNKVGSIRQFISQEVRVLEQKIDRNVKATIDASTKLHNELQDVSKSIPKDILKKEDFSFELGQQFKKLDSLKDVSEDLESLPANYKSIKSELANINDKLDNVSTSSVKKSSVKVPKHEKAVADLATYMRDGVDQLENMSRLYVETIADIESVKIEKAQHTEQLSKFKDEGIKEGIQKGEGLLAKKIAEQFPTEFEEIKSIFSSVISFEYAVGQVVEVTNDNKNGLMPYFSTELELGEYKVISSDTLIAGDIVIKAKVEKVAQSTEEG